MENDPELFNFLTEIVADRFDSKRPISDRTIGRYLATDIIGTGGYSIVYKGIDTTNDQPVAIKMLRHHMVTDTELLEKFRNEAKIVAGLDHENIVSVVDIKERFKTAFIMMEYLKGDSIADLLRREKKIHPEQAVNYLIQVCRALEYAHKKGILHKDINPENLMVCENHLVKLLDFGLAGFIQDEDDLLDGAFSYLAPEIIDGEVSTIQSEIYSLGITAFEMVTGRRPYPEEDSATFVTLRRKTQIPDPGELVPDLPEALQHFIIKACRIAPGERYAAMDEVVKELSPAMRDIRASFTSKINCWEFMKCERGPGERLHDQGGICPATKGSSLDGLNEGKQAGRACWLVAGTFCNHTISGTYAQKIESCRHCRFYKQVNKVPGQTRLSIDNVDIFGLTHIGLLPKKNEDRYLVRQMADKSLLLAVADGLGGDMSSDYAAEMAKGTLAGLKRLKTGEENSQLRGMILDLDTLISEKSQTRPELDGMATTLVCAILKQDHIHWVHVGDSRLYLLRDQKLAQLTEDQTLAKFLIEEGELSPDKAKEHYSYELLDQCIGYGECTPQTGAFKVEKNDLMILSTDGLHKMVPRATVLSILNNETSIEKKTKQLTQAALDSGGRDNITIVLAKINQTLA